MIIKSLIIASIILKLFGFTGLSQKFDRAVVRSQSNPTTFAIASNISTVLPEIVPRPIVKSSTVSPSIYAHHYLLADAESGKVLLKESAKERVPIASTTKIMTAIIVLENYQLDEVVTISETAAYQIGADTFLRPGERISVHNLLKALLIKSGNDSAYALAEHMNKPGEQGIEKFVAKMNQKAKELGMEDTEYHDPAGLDTTGYSTAFDLFLASRYALSIETFAKIVRSAQDVAKNIDGTIYHELNNSNRLVNEYNYPGAIGVKTGYMPEAGHVLVSAVEREGHTLIGVVIRTFADTAPASADESKKLMDWGFSNITW